MTGGVLTWGLYEDVVDEQAPGGPARTTITLPFPVFAAGWDTNFDPLTAGTGQDVYVFFQGGGFEIIEVRNQTTDGDAIEPSFTGFVRFISDMPVTHMMVIREGDQINLGSGELYHADNLVFSNAIPSPATLAILLPAMAVCGLRRRR